MINLSQHTITNLANETRLHCTVCKNSVATSDIAVNDWPCSPCNITKVLPNKPININHPIQVGHLSTHPSHHMRFFHGAFYCSECGSMSDGVSKMKTLADKCDGPAKPKSKGASNLSAINNRGVLPYWFKPFNTQPGPPNSTKLIGIPSTSSSAPHPR